MLKGLLFLIWLLPLAANANQPDCIRFGDIPSADQIANYDISVVFQPGDKTLEGEIRIIWKNTSPIAVHTLQFHMYLNAFKNNASSFFIQGGNRAIRSKGTDRPKSEWGWIDLKDMVVNNAAISPQQMQYIQPDDNNETDQTVMETVLSQPIIGGEKAIIDLSFKAKIPKTFLRVGYRKNFYHLVQWFPKLGVFEKNNQNQWGWNCHQFHAQTEFYANFGRYQVEIIAPANYDIAASGCLMDSTRQRNINRYCFIADDVIDFAWSAFPDFERHTFSYKDVEVQLNSHEAHRELIPRYKKALFKAFEYMEKHVGAFPYPVLKVVDPPYYALNSSAMEYPTLITTGGFCMLPENIKTSEILSVHEFCHQYFMAVVATNEQEAAWMDEGIVAYFEDKIMDQTYSPERSVIDLLGIQVGDRELSRLRYTTMDNPRSAPLTDTSYQIPWGYRSLIYSKTATAWHTLEQHIGQEAMNNIFREYFQTWKFNHPRKEDLFAIVREYSSSDVSFDVDSFLLQVFEGTGVCDYSVTHISSKPTYSLTGYFDSTTAEKFTGAYPSSGYISEIVLHREGAVVLPVDILVQYKGNKEEIFSWTGQTRVWKKEWVTAYPIQKIIIDPEGKNLLDINLNNNSYVVNPSKKPALKVGIKLQHFIQTAWSLL